MIGSIAWEDAAGCIRRIWIGWPSAGSCFQRALRGAGVCWLPERLVAGELDQGRLVLAAGEQWYVDLKIAIFSLPKTRFGLSADIWQHLKSDRVGLPPYDPHHG